MNWICNILYTDKLKFCLQNCHKCKVKFDEKTTIHHCRACGQGFCEGCSTKKRPCAERNWGMEPVRVCDLCCEKKDSDQHMSGWVLYAFILLWYVGWWSGPSLVDVLLRFYQLNDLLTLGHVSGIICCAVYDHLCRAVDVKFRVFCWKFLHNCFFFVRTRVWWQDDLHAILVDRFVLPGLLLMSLCVMLPYLYLSLPLIIKTCEYKRMKFKWMIVICSLVLMPYNFRFWTRRKQWTDATQSRRSDRINRWCHRINSQLPAR